jgi:transcription elongation factor Elf1
MPKRNIRVTKWIGMIPAVAVCSACGKEFKVSVNELRQVSAAQQSLQTQFSEHECDMNTDNA